MSTVNELYRDIGDEIGDPGNARNPTWLILRWINKAINDSALLTNCLQNIVTISGERLITVLDFGALDIADAIITLQTSADAASTDYTEGVDWDAATSNAVTATNIATTLSRHNNTEAYSDGVMVYVCATGGYTITTLTTDADVDEMTIADNGYETFELNNILTGFRKAKNIYSTGQEIIFRPYTRQQYDRALIDTTYVGYGYYIDPSYKMYLKHAGVNVDSSVTFVVEYLYYPTTLSLSTESPPGILAHFDDLIIQKVKYYYYLSKAMLKEADVADSLYKRQISNVRYELRSQGEPQEIRQLLKWH